MQALVLVDLQNDFLEGGALAVENSLEVLPVALEQIEKFDHVIATRDWHPKNHVSFASAHEGKKVNDVITVNGVDQVLWPDHCVQNTYGADLSEELPLEKIDKIINKGEDPNVDSYSAFWDVNHGHSTGLTQYLHAHSIDSIAVMGLATDYCVKFTVLDGIEEGFNVTLITSGSRGVNVQPGDDKRAIEEMKQAGAQIV